MGWLSGTISLLTNISRAFQLSHPVGPRDGDRPRRGSDPECDGANCRTTWPSRTLSVKRDDVLFEVDPTPFQYKLTQLQPSLAAAKQQTKF